MTQKKRAARLRVGGRSAAYAGGLLILAAAGVAAWDLAESATADPGAAPPAPQVAPARPDTAELIARIEGPQPPGRGELAALTMNELMRRFGVPGMGVAVVRDYDIHWTKSYGVADRATGRPVDDRTLFQAASISKPVTAMAALRLVQEGRLPLDGDINAILTSWQVPQREGDETVTPRSLMTHTSGADDGFGFPGYSPGASLPSLVQILTGRSPSNVGPVRFTRPPFRAYKYSGGSYVIMQLALTELTGRPFDEVMRALVLEPLGMSNSTYAQPLPDTLHARAAHAHGRQGAPGDVAWKVHPEQAAAGLWTTPADLARVVIEVQHGAHGRGAVLTDASARAMTSPVGIGPFAIGFAVGRQAEGWYFEHSGSNYGFQGLIRGHIRHGYGVVVLTNAAGGGRVAEEIATRVAHAYDWDSTHGPLRR